VSAETIAAGGYAAFLVVLALALDTLGRHTHSRAGRFRTRGFSYRPELDLWECPEGEHLRPYGIDHGRRLARYRARPAICNGCPAKDGCTDSDDGREVVRAMDPWPHSEAGRFHRGISVALLAIASMIALAGLALTPAAPDLLVLGLILVATLGLCLRLARALVGMPSGFPGEAVPRSSK
jgi:hypothetical protein